MKPHIFCGGSVATGQANGPNAQAVRYATSLAEMASRRFMTRLGGPPPRHAQYSPAPDPKPDSDEGLLRVESERFATSHNPLSWNGLAFREERQAIRSSHNRFRSAKDITSCPATIR